MTTASAGCCCPPGMEHIQCRVHGPDAPYVPPALFNTDMAGPIILRLPFARPPILVNEARAASGHWGEAEAKKIVAQAVVVVARKARVPVLDRVAVTVTWHVAGYGVHDADSLATMAKAAVDALTPARPAIPRGALTTAGTKRKKAQAAKLGVGIIPDDHAVYVESVTLRIVLGATDPRIELRLDPLPALPPRPATARPKSATRTSAVLRRAPRRR